MTIVLLRAFERLHWMRPVRWFSQTDAHLFFLNLDTILYISRDNSHLLEHISL